MFGRRTGLRAGAPVAVDQSGMEDLDAFWKAAGPAAASPAAPAPAPSPSPSPSPPRRQSDVSFAAAPEILGQDDGGGMGWDDDDRGGDSDGEAPSRNLFDDAAVEDDEDSDDAAAPVRPSSHGKRQRRASALDSDSDSDAGAAAEAASDSSSSSDDDVLAQRRAAAAKKKKKAAAAAPKPKPKPKPKAKKAKAKAKPRESDAFSVASSSDSDDSGSDDGGYARSPSPDDGRRRSRRQKFAPVKFWKSERLQYGLDDESGLTYVRSVINAAPTPAPSRRKKAVKGLREAKRARAAQEAEAGFDDGTIDHDAAGDRKPAASAAAAAAAPAEEPVALPAGASFRTDSAPTVWCEETEQVSEKRTICFGKDLEATPLPITADRPRGREAVGTAAQSFSVSEISGAFPGWISGYCLLPPLGIKDAEGVGLCSQVFFVGECQDQALEFAMATPDPEEPNFNKDTAQRFLLSRGDHFYVPPNNVYRLENHSMTTPCKLYWTIVRPTTPGAAAAGEGEAAAV